MKVILKVIWLENIFSHELLHKAPGTAEQPSYLRRACLTARFYCVLCMPWWISCLFFFRCKHKMFLWFHFASESFHGCHYKLCFLLEQRYWKIFHYIHLWIIVQSVWCQSPFQSLSSASPYCLALFLAPSCDPLSSLLLLLSQPGIPEQLPHFISCSHGGEHPFLFTLQWRDKPTW